MGRRTPENVDRKLMETPLKRDDFCVGLRQSGKDKCPTQTCYTSFSGAEEQSTCSGDPDGPLMYRREGKLVCILGIFSFVSHSRDLTDRTCVFTAVTLFKNWIYQHIEFLHSEKYNGLAPDTLYVEKNGMLVYDHLKEL